ncbi:unnamed protein product [Mycena citricolor]|uniref:Phytase A n=1 Tax=Mycena citricolor TaxID=2018698 RepID=A0AAD2HXR8_9AGAR|nr:unnamed protein product [Mycena citricolor]
MSLRNILFPIALTSATLTCTLAATDITQLWGPGSPYFPSGTYTGPPPGCSVTQVNLIQRHGARFPTSTKAAASVAKLQRVASYTDPAFDFLKTFKYDLGVASLVPFGAQQSFESGQLMFQRYKTLLTSGSEPFVRADSSQRVVDSATNWTAGFSAASHGALSPTLTDILSGNDTLDDSSCANAGSSDNATSAWLAVYGPPITARLNKAAPGANLTDDDMVNIMGLCSFETVASAPFAPGKGASDLQLSPFCSLFSVAEFKAAEYSSDLDKYYGTGHGGFLGRVQGVGYVLELIARLTNTPVPSLVNINTTLDASHATFPLDRTFYVDFTHDNELVAIYAALGLFKQAVPLPTTAAVNDGVGKAGQWVASRLVPFSGRMVTEKLRCGAAQGDFVRIFVNDALQPLEFCNGGHSKEGLCTLDAFVESQAYSVSGGLGDWDLCFS